MDWITVKERLPDTSDDVLAYSPDDGCYRAWCDNGVWLSHENTNQHPPTHWMPLPKPPRAGIPNPSGSFGMTDQLVTSSSRPYSVWSETMETAKDIRDAWEARFGGPYKIVKSNQGFQVKYMGEWKGE
jgi:hypothetical protein